MAEIEDNIRFITVVLELIMVFVENVKLWFYSSLNAIENTNLQPSSNQHPMSY